MSSPESSLVSVVVPTHNRVDLLPLTLRSALSQNGIDLEVIVVDEGSTDGTAELVSGMDDARVRLVRNETPRGVCAARNQGAALARGTWLAFLDDDDLWAPGKLLRQLEAAAASERAWVYAGSVNFTPALRVVGGAPPLPPDQLVAELPEINVVPGGASGTILSRALFDAAGGFDESLHHPGDWDLWLRLAATHLPAWAPSPLVGYRVHTANMSLDALGVEADFAVVAARSGRASYAALYRYLGWWCRRAGRRRDALRYFIRGALRREDRYPLRDFLSDVSYVLLDGAEAVRARRAAWLPEVPLPSGSNEHAEWRRQGQDWIERLARAQGA
jgi:glycosyltransferase involved in cell wall biosynthesis